MPGFSPDNFKYVSSCLWCTLSKFSTDFISMITISSTNISVLKPAFNLTSSYITGKVSWRLILSPFAHNSWHKANSYTVSNKPGPKVLSTLKK